MKQHQHQQPTLDAKARRMLREAAKQIEELVEVMHCTTKPNPNHRPTQQSHRVCQTHACKAGMKKAQDIKDYLKDSLR